MTDYSKKLYYLVVYFIILTILLIFSYYFFHVAKLNCLTSESKSVILIKDQFYCLQWNSKEYKVICEDGVHLVHYDYSLKEYMSCSKIGESGYCMVIKLNRVCEPIIP